jgi:hypothetical protein
MNDCRQIERIYPRDVQAEVDTLLLLLSWLQIERVAAGPAVSAA